MANCLYTLFSYSHLGSVFPLTLNSLKFLSYCGNSTKSFSQRSTSSWVQLCTKTKQDQVSDKTWYWTQTHTHTLCYTRIPSDDFQLLQSSSTVMCWSSLCRLLCLLVCCCFMSSIMNCDIGEKQYNRVKIGLFKILLWGTTLKCEDKCHKDIILFELYVQDK